MNAWNGTELRKIFEARGNLFLESMCLEIDCSKLLVYVTEVNYEFSILTWHIDSEIWYNIEKPSRNCKRKFSKILSDYMLYLLLKRPNMVSAVAGIAQVMSLDILRELKYHVRDEIKDVERLCKRLFEVDPINFCTPFREGITFKKGIRLAHKIKHLEEMKWTVTRAECGLRCCCMQQFILRERHKCRC